ncbi:histidine kinase Ecym_4020 [Eremothecium cymbalariae DBVPG|uniref:histidine kinase n=1 Tax=Eremothecium cymbalariae (strain CBS 270.75 / DBVPG 7215 / KCTC 17166 / NRRL Y-17582) TaxID=931890 RepID=G8JSV0_ERECY|nr:hypothetical protein Ecym_4020 [Eremothecium cymbalariae DBVPG\
MALLFIKKHLSIPTTRRIRKHMFRPPYKAGLSTQLTILVCIIALCSLIILAVTTGVYFTTNYKSLRADRLTVAAQLTSAQINQTLNIIYYQCYWLSSRDSIQNALVSYKVGNTSSLNLDNAKEVLVKFLDSSNSIFRTHLYDSAFNEVLSVSTNSTGNIIGDDLLRDLLPLSSNSPLPSSIIDDGMLSNPVFNGSSFFMSMSLPVSAKASILYPKSDTVGYITMVMSADQVSSVCAGKPALNGSTVSVLAGVYDENNILNSYQVLFPPSIVQVPRLLEIVFPIANNSFLYNAFVNRSSGSVSKTNAFYEPNVAVGYAACSFKLVNWVAVVAQQEAVFLSPSTKLTKIIIGTVIGIAFFICIVTFIVANWAVKPIVRLQKATELIAAGRGLRSYRHSSRSSSRTTSINRSNSKGSPSPTLREGDGLRKTPPSPYTPMHSHVEPNPSGIGREYSVDIARAIGIEVPSSHPSERVDAFTTSANWIETRVPVYRRLFSDELSELTDTFNSMTDELDRHYALLEDRVRARTKQLEAAKIQAESANEAKTMFIANISHELRTPLNGILGMTAIAMAENDMEKVQNSLKLIFRSGELLLHILTELLTFSKNILKRNKLEQRNFSMVDVALQVKSIFGKLAKDQNVKFSIFLMPNLIRKMVLWGDSNRIIQIVMNLVSNALKFTPVDGKVSLRIKLLGEYDEEESEKCNNAEVFIKQGTEISDETKNVFDTITEEKYVSCSGESTDDTIETGQEGAQKPDKADNISVVSSGTSSYDDAIFHSRFKKIPAVLDVDEGDLSSIGKSEKKKVWVISIEVEDTGPGIDPSLQESVFKPFVQGDQTLSRQYGGTGLGLSICRQLSTMMKGTMKLHSEVGVGSKFIFTVPLRQTGTVEDLDDEDLFEDEFNAQSKINRRVKFKLNKGGKSRQSSLSVPEISGVPDSPLNSMGRSESELSVSSVRVDRPFLQSTGTATSTRSIPTVGSLESNFKVLVAEDNNVNQEVIKRMLQLEGIYDIELACDGEEALEKVANLTNQYDHYNIVFMDVQMPKMDGLIATRNIRKELNYTYPIVALTAFADDSNIKVCLESGMDGFLSKPIKREKLRKILLEYCPVLNKSVSTTTNRGLEDPLFVNSGL